MIAVTHVSTNEKNGGAARAAHRLHEGLRGIGVDSRMYVRSKSSQDDAVKKYKAPSSIIQRVRNKLVGRWLTLEKRAYIEMRPDVTGRFSLARTIQASQSVQQLPSATIYNLHWINDFIDPLRLIRATNTPIVWTLHDMNPFTGGCHYNVGCTRYRRSCGKCPQLGSVEENDLSKKIWEHKKAAYEEAIASNRLWIVTPSKWLASNAQSSTLFCDAPVSVIPYGLDHKVFCPRDTEGLRNALSIPDDHRIVLFVAGSTKAQRKGFDLLVDTLNGLQFKKVTLLSIGSKAPRLEVKFPHRHLGSLNSNILLSIFYSLADLFVIPSRQDNLPNTVLESMACGTPVAGFDVGGIPDMVRPGETGWLAEPESVRSLRDTITIALSEGTVRKRMGQKCREVVGEEYTLNVQAKAYESLYRTLTS